jgi:hypothetical protein
MKPKRRAAAIEVNGEFYLNIPGAVRMAYETDLKDIKQENRARIQAFQGRVNAFLEAQEMATGRRPNLEDALSTLVDYDRMEELLRSGQFEAALNVMFEVLAA